MPLIVVEGIDGSSKTTVVENLTRQIENIGKHVLSFREPGGTTSSETIRRLIDQEQTNSGRLFLFLAARANLCALISKHLTADPKMIILLDRFTPSTLAYQTEYPLEFVVQADRIARTSTLGAKPLEPDLVLWLDLPVDEALIRLAEKQGGDLGIYERKELLETARGRYQQQFDADQLEARKWRRLDASLTKDELLEEVVNKIVVLLATGQLVSPKLP